MGLESERKVQSFLMVLSKMWYQEKHSTSDGFLSLSLGEMGKLLST
jgi:hypothetical protein